MAKPILEVRRLSKRYQTLTALDSVDLAVQEGEIFGLLGPNGAGKTTLLSIISSLLEPSSGEVRIAGHRLERKDRNLRRLLGIVPQELAIYGDLSARENLVFFGQLYGSHGAELQQRVAQILGSIGLAERADERAAHYSGGMKRRLNLGAGLVHHPQLLLLDEPTTGVDPQSRHHIFEEVRRLNAAGVTIVYTSHYMEEVQTLCSRIGIIDHGKLIACDTLPALLQRLPGSIRFRVPEMSSALRERIEHLPDARLSERGAGLFEIQGRDAKQLLLPFVAILHDLNVAVSSLETEEPNLERVFLHLTGRGLRD
jgi:ABC-2 type transport system ATP-binding protein